MLYIRIYQGIAFLPFKAARLAVVCVSCFRRLFVICPRNILRVVLANCNPVSYRTGMVYVQRQERDAAQRQIRHVTVNSIVDAEVRDEASYMWRRP